MPELRGGARASGPRASAASSMQPRFDTVKGSEAVILLDNTGRKLTRVSQPGSGPRSSPTAHRPAKSGTKTPIQFQEGELNHPGLLSTSLGYSTAEISYDGRPDKSVVVPYRRRGDEPISDADIIVELETKYPECCGKLARQISASMDSESLLSQSCSISFADGLKSNYTMRDTSISNISALSGDSMFKAVSDTHISFDEALQAARRDRAKAAHPTMDANVAIIYNGTGRPRAQNQARQVLTHP
ncbi:hypothetical protein GMRT_11045 [Giardia muris]|uniref:Uncharacterized protein n=1 Tax=Giardia muris TaxID=5742 RepID=A0A4Z1T2A9_GIAMU|nr:hypothetical protein GMRT_11045 [Giardia muris]|eukprot:TNJ27167.1 hypothetical protein GMRT_11045 [Giardia muris]